MATLPNIAPGMGGPNPTGSTSTAMPMTQFDNSNTTPYGALTMSGQGPLLGWDSGMSSIDTLGALYRSDNPLLAAARGRAGNYAAARGAGADSASYAYNAEQGMADQLAPLAQQDATARARVAAGNQDVASRLQLEREGSAATRNAAATARASAMDVLNAQQAHDTATRAQDRLWQVADQGTAALASARSQFFSGLESQLFSDPSFLRDPQGMMGALSELGGNFDQIFNQWFPEYATAQQTGSFAPPATPAPPVQPRGGR